MANIQKTKITKVFDLIQNRKKSMLAALPKHITAERLINIVMNVVRINPKLLECTEMSLIGSIMMSVYTGLEPSVLGHCYLVPYGKQVQFIIGYKGFLQLTNNSGQVSFVYSEVVRENDFFEYELGLTPKLVHKPSEKERGKLTHTYTIANLKDGSKPFLVMNRIDVLKIKEFALKNKKNPKDKSLPWNAWEDEMWKKTGIRRISKSLPLSVESQRLIAQDETVKTFDASFENVLSQPDETIYGEGEIINEDVPEVEVDGSENKALESLMDEMWKKYKTEDLVKKHLKRLSAFTPKGKNQKEVFVDDFNKLKEKPEWAGKILNSFRKENNPDVK